MYDNKAIWLSLDVIKTMIETMMKWMNEGPIERCLTVSTGHMPGPYVFGRADAKGLRHVEHFDLKGDELGIIVFIGHPGPDYDIADWVENEVRPEWIRPLYLYALEQGCSLINFDRDAELLDGFQEYDW